MRRAWFGAVAACLLVGGVAACGQNACPVTAMGAKGDCIADDTAAFQQAADKCGSFYVPRQTAPSKCYRVNGVRLHPGVTITFEDRNTELWPTSADTKYVFAIEGDSLKSPSGYTTIRNGELRAPYTMAAGTAGIRIDYGDHVRLEDLVINGFYDDVFADNTGYLYLTRVTANGATHANVWHQHSDTHHGPYFGGPLYIENSTLDSCECAASSIWVQDIAVVNVTDSDIVGVRKGQGFHADSSNGRSGSPPDYPSGIHLHGDTFDSIGAEAIYVHNYLKSDILGSWISGGRPTHSPCIDVADNVQDFSISDTHSYWCGAQGLVIETARNVVVTNSTFSGNPSIGIYNKRGVSSFFFGNHCDATTYNGNGSGAQEYCIYEDTSASFNTYLRNDATGTSHGNVYRGKNATIITR
jgi:hypothetical protein